MKLTWYGHSNFKIEAQGQTMLIDPFFTGNPTSPIDYTDIKKADMVLLTHDHRDHVGDSIEICKATGAKLIGVFDTINILAQQGIEQDKCLGMNIGGTIEVGGVKIKMVQAMHSTASGAATGFIMTFESGYCIYHSGDTGIFSSMELFARFHDIDLAILPIGGHFTMDPMQAAHACKLLSCANVAAMHWGTFPILEQNTERFAKFLGEAAPDTKLINLTPGEPYKL